MANNTCVGGVQTNLIRASRLLPAGYIDAGSSNGYRTDSVVEIGATPNYKTGSEIEQENGSGALCTSYKIPDSYKRHDMSMTLCQADAELLELLTGATVITEGGNSIGSKFSREIGDFICLEAWQTIIEDTEPTGEYLHWVWPRVRFRPAARTLNSGAVVFPLTGEGYPNSNIGLGPVGDWPTVMNEPENWFVDDAIPTSLCGYITLAVGS